MPVKSKAIDETKVTPEDLKRFKAKTIKLSNGCILWVGAKDRDGYGVFFYGNRRLKAHRFSYIVANGNTPDDEVLDHFFCNTRECVNPKHLESVSSVENTRRGRALISECPRGHSLDHPNNIIFRNQRNGVRGCRACDNGGRRIRKYIAQGVKMTEAAKQAITDSYYENYTRMPEKVAGDRALKGAEPTVVLIDDLEKHRSIIDPNARNFTAEELKKALKF